MQGVISKLSNIKLERKK